MKSLWSVVAAALVVCFAPAVSAAQTLAGSGHAAALFPDASVLVVGGRAVSGTPESGVLFFDALKQYEAVSYDPGLLTARADHTATGMFDGRILVVGGTDGAEVLGSIEIFDLATGEFTDSGVQLETPRAGHEAVTLRDGRVLIRGGVDALDRIIPESKSEVYDPRTGRISAAEAGLEYAVVYSDYLDYVPGQTVYLWGDGWNANEQIKVLVDEDPLDDAPAVYTVRADEYGTLSGVSIFVVQPKHVGTTFTLQAVGVESGVSAMTSFTDATGSLSTSFAATPPTRVCLGCSLAWTVNLTTSVNQAVPGVTVSMAVPAGVTQPPPVTIDVPKDGQATGPITVTADFAATAQTAGAKTVTVTTSTPVANCPTGATCGTNPITNSFTVLNDAALSLTAPAIDSQSGTAANVSATVTNIAPTPGATVNNITVTFAPVNIVSTSGTLSVTCAPFNVSALTAQASVLATATCTSSGGTGTYQVSSSATGTDEFANVRTASSAIGAGTITVTGVVTAPTSLIYSSNPATYTKGQAITANTPSNQGGAIASYSVSPELPSGLSLDAATGVISGTPAAMQSAQTYTVTGTNTAGATTVTIAITVNDAPPANLTYSPNTYVFTKGTASSVAAPTSSGGAVTSYTVAPVLPAGLSLNTTSGAISGTPTTVQQAAQYTVTAANAGGSTTARLTITVNDVAPAGLSYSSQAPIYTKGTPITNNVPTVSGGAVTSYSVSPELPAGLSLDAITGVISGTPTVMTAAADYTVTAANSGGSTNATVTITVNDAAPSSLTYLASTYELTKGTAASIAAPTNSGGAVTSFAVAPSLPQGLSLDVSTGAISGTPTTVQPATQYTVTASNSGGSTTATLTITVNDVAPTSLAYSPSTLFFTKGTVSSVAAPTSSGGAVTSYSVSPGLPAGLSLNTTTGAISGTPTTVQSATQYTVTATNSGGSTTATVTITVNDAAPTNLTYTPSTYVFTKGAASSISAPTSSGGAVVSYSVSPGLPAGLSLNTTTGAISGTPTTVQSGTQYTVTATNSGGSTTATVTITVNDAAPTNLVYSPNAFVFTTGTAVSIVAPSSSGGAVVSYSVSPALPDGLSLNGTTGAISGAPTTVQAATQYTVTASNSGGSTTAEVTITVNDAAPANLAYFANPAVYTKGVTITANTPTSSGGAVVTYSVTPALPSGLSLNATTGAITGTPSVVSSASTYRITATNSGGSAFVDVSITVNDIPPVDLAYSANPAVYTKGAAIAPNSPSTSGGAVASYSVSPALPTGLSLNTMTGVIAGTPTTLATAATYRVTATNGAGSTFVDVTITVNDAAPAALVYSANPAVYTKGEAIPSNTPTSSGGAVVSYSVSSVLPAGLSLNATTGAISGTPTAVQPATQYTVTASNSGGSTTATVTITVNDAAPTNLAYTPNTYVFTVGTASSIAAPTSSGGAVVSYSVTPALPTGLSLDTSTGAISGTPTNVVAASTYTVTATNTGGFTSVGVSITVNDIAPTSLVYAVSSAVYTKDVAIAPNNPTSSGGVVASYSVFPPLPSGLTLNTTTGVIAGTPTVLAPAATYTVTAMNATGSTDADVVITVNDAAPANLAYGQTTAAYTKGTPIAENSPTSTGGAVVSYTITPALPAGLSLNTTTGVISGTPTALAPAATYRVTASNTGGTAIADVSIAVNDVPPASLVYSANPATYTKGTAIASNTPTATGGPIVSYAVSPSLPAGLSLNSSTGSIVGTPTAVAATATYQVTATNSGGSTRADLVITVNDAAPTSLAYSRNPAVYTTGVTIQANTPTNSGGAATSYSVSPGLPAGLSLNPTTGVISGTPTELAAVATYQVTASNVTGSTIANVVITVNDAAPTALEYLANPAIYTRDAAITPNMPSSSGGPVVSYTISPALPTGLTFDTTTGIISGTPTVLATPRTYRVTAANTGGSTFADISIRVNDVAPSTLTYAANPALYTRGRAIPPNSPASAGGPVVSYTVSPALPAGLILNTSTGVISGTPTVLAAAANYQITATNSGGSASVNLSITVNDIPTYAVNTSVVGSGSVTPTVRTVEEGSSAVFTASPDTADGWSLTSWSPNCTPTFGKPLECTVSNVMTDGITVTATFTQATYSVTATATGGGTIEASETSVLHGRSVTFTATPNTQNHYLVGAWTGCSAPEGSPTCTVTNVKGTLNVSVSFVLETFAIARTVNPEGWGGISGPLRAEYGKNYNFIAYPQSGYAFASWTKCPGTKSGATCSVTNVTGPIELAADFREASSSFDLAVKRSGTVPGTVTAQGATLAASAEGWSASVAIDALVLLTAEDDDNAIFYKWNGCDSVSGRVCTVRMYTNRAVDATFVPAEWLLTVGESGLGSGTVTGSVVLSGDGSGWTAIVPNTTPATGVTLTATENPGSIFVGWTGCDSVTGKVCTVSMASARSATVYWAPANYTLNVTKTGAGTGSMTASTALSTTATGWTASVANSTPATSVTLTANPTGGSTVGSWTGCDNASGNTCTVTMDRARNVTVTFLAASYTLNVTKSGIGTGAVAATGYTLSPTATGWTTTVPATSPATQVTLVATPASGSLIYGWNGCTSVINNKTTCLVTMSGAKNVSITFRK